ncbi:hypothetical protein [Nitrospira sp. Nam74]
MASRELTYDEKKAAEAAFRGLPVNSSWSAAAREVYEGIILALGEKAPSQQSGDEGDLSSARGSSPEAPPTTRDLAVTEPQQQVPVQLLNRQEAIEAGILVDVSSIAEQVGLRLSVGISKPLWELGITASHQFDDEECHTRVRDVLLALRLHVEQAEITAPWIKFRALLSLPPETQPQMCTLVAIAHKDSSAPYALTVMLPEEMSGISVSE